MSLTYKKLNTLFKALDQEDQLLSYRINKWVAWPIVKETLWLTFKEENSSLNIDRDSSISMLYILRSLPSMISTIFDIIKIKKTKIVLAYSPSYNLIDNRFFHPNFGFETTEGMLENSLKLLYQRKNESMHHTNKNVMINTRNIDLLLKPIVKLLCLSPVIKKLSGSIIRDVSNIESNVNADKLRKICINKLASFVVKEKVYRYIFKKSNAKYLVIQDPNGKMPEVAAAKSLDMLVIEMQHGIFSRDDIDYSWTNKHSKLKSFMLTPDKILVYGKIWKQVLCSNQYWTDDEIIEVGYPLIDYYHTLNNKCRNYLLSQDRINILFISQNYVGKQAEAFWSEFLLKCRESNINIHIHIKLHPNECALPEPYKKLLNNFVECSILPVDFNAYVNISQFQFIIGYSSMMLVDFVGLGKTTYSIVCSESGEGMTDMFQLAELGSTIKPIYSVQCLFLEISQLNVNEPDSSFVLNKEIFYDSQKQFSQRLSAVIKV